MIVDSSALIAILRSEPEADQFAELIVSQPAQISAANWLEASMVASGQLGPTGAVLVDQLVEELGVKIVPVTVEEATRARLAFQRYGRGSGSPARLNFGDCFAYALSSVTGEPLLFKGDDFTHTDVLRVVSDG
ncbi:MAG: type II toxin-antitoxin system VapC family toxin [Microlunatus sp.]